jgi:hypothetical protein
MKITDAIARYRLYFALGYTMKIGTILLYLVSFLTFVYMQGMELKGTPGVGHLFQQMGDFAYAIIVATYPYSSFLWNHALIINQAEPLSYGNLGILGLVGVALLSIQITKIAKALRHQVKIEIRRMERAGSMPSYPQGSATTINASQIAQVNIYNQNLPSDPKSGWANRPLVKFALSILGAYLAAVLAKLTGMV